MLPSHTSVPAIVGELHAVKYVPCSSGELAPGTASYVEFRVGSVRVVLSPASAADLLEALPLVLAQHDYAEFLAESSKAVAR
ncbi:hypothetical protein JK358_34235 [Nocardia sp. 2]|uniref:Uncharacterized protein n=1 Tax=Nocardia acididurans TaxID=2802282 RepID=A0ABS1MFZ0_9NOCA|nr:hypothetical protein [Nocardia acididurans]MBL1079477.1 hypothetical protein [Nocardia acididurans]